MTLGIQDIGGGHLKEGRQNFRIFGKIYGRIRKGVERKIRLG